MTTITPTAARRTLSPRIAYALAGAIIGLALFASGTPSPIYGIYRELWGFSPLVLTLVYATYAFGVLGALLLAGRVSDAVGRRPVLLAALGTLMAATVLFMLADSVVWLFVARGVQGLATGAALGDIRDVVRGIHPPVLADRGLAGAVEAIALDLAVPVSVTPDLPDRLPAPVESAVYFAVVECLANVGKHAAAEHAWVDLRHVDDLLTVVVGDDGCGGADPAAGTGLRGVARRLAALDGTGTPVGTTGPAAPTGGDRRRLALWIIGGVAALTALVVLLVRLHLAGFFWGDVSLSNVLFRRSAGGFAAYLVDAETGELRPQLSDQMREHDITVGCENVFAEVLDLQASGSLDEKVEAWDIAELIEARYLALWSELTDEEEFPAGEMWRIEQRIERLNDLGFDVDELDIVTDFDGDTVRIQPKVVEAGHHQRELQALTGLHVEDAQARRLLNDLASYTAHFDLGREDRSLVANRWLDDIYEPVTAMVPPEARGSGVAMKLVERLVADARAQGFTVVPACSYVDAAFRRHPDWADVLASPGE